MTLSSCVWMLTCVAAWSCVSASPTAQVPAEPDFSGEWVLLKGSSSASDQAFALTVRQSITRTNIYGSPPTTMRLVYCPDEARRRRAKSGVT